MKNELDIFVSMPYGSDAHSEGYWKRFFEQGIDPVSAKSDQLGYKPVFHRADLEPSALDLKESVQRLLDKCDVCLAVITGANPNVFWEVGYAVAKEKPVIYVVEKDIPEKQYSPVLVAGALKIMYDGTVFDDTDPVSGKLREFQQQIRAFLKVARTIAAGMHKPAPQYAVYCNRELVGLPEIVAKATRSVSLITTNLSYFANEDLFKVSFENEERFAFDIPVKRGVDVKILALNPDSIIAEYRARQLGRDHDIAGYREQLRKAAKFLYKRYLQYPNVDIRIYDDLPLQITAIVDNKVVTSIVSRGQQARNNIHASFDIDYAGARASFEKHIAEVLAQVQTCHISRFAWVRQCDNGEKDM